MVAGANVTPMRAIVQPSRVLLVDFNRNRWQWLDGVEEDAELNPTAKVLASVLARRCADHITGDCFPRNELLMRLMGGKSVDTVQRAFRALEARGWLRRGEARGRGSKAAVTFLMTAKVIYLKAVETTPSEAKPATCGAKTSQASALEKAADMQQKHRKYAASRIYPKSIQKEREQSDDALGRPSPQCSKFVPTGSDWADEWDQYHAAKGFQPLAVIGLRISHNGVDGYDLPFNRPPKADHNEIDRAIAMKFAAWATAEAAKAYRLEQSGNPAMYVAQSDNWLKQKRWNEFLEHLQVTGADVSGIDGTARLLEAIIKCGGYVPSSARSANLAAHMVQTGLVMPEDLRRVGVHL